MMDEEDDDDDEDEEDEDESPRRMHNDDDIDDEYYDRVSADVVLNKGLRKRDKEKSSSLQDLSIYRDNMYIDIHKKRQPASLIKRNYLNIPQNMFPVSHSRRKQVAPEKYQHV